MIDFFTRALIVGICISIVAPFIGSFLVVRRYSLLADTIAHVSLIGFGITLLVETDNLIIPLITTVAATLIIDYLRSRKVLTGDTALALFLSGSLAAAVLLTSVGGGNNFDLHRYLFGSIVVISQTNMMVIILLSTVVTFLLLVAYQRLLLVLHDEDFAYTSGIPVQKTNTFFMVLVAITIVVAIQTIGALMIGGLLIIPVITAMKFASSFQQTVLTAIVIGLINTLIGLFASYQFDLPSGATVILLLIICFMLSHAITSGNIAVKKYG